MHNNLSVPMSMFMFMTRICTSTSTSTSTHTKHNIEYIIEYKYKKFLGIPYHRSAFKLSICGNYSTQSIILPDTLLFLFVKYYNEPLVLVQSLIFLSLGPGYNCPVTLPDSLMYLIIGNHFNQPIKLPEMLQYLKLGRGYNQPIVLPNKLRCLELCGQDVILPKQLLYLGFDTGPNPKLHLPQTLKTIIFSNSFTNADWYLDNLPNTVTTVVLGCSNRKLSYNNVPKTTTIVIDHWIIFHKYCKPCLDNDMELFDYEYDISTIRENSAY